MKIYTLTIYIFATLAMLSIFQPTKLLAGDSNCAGGTSCMIIFDMTANPGDVAIVTNLSLAGGGSRNDTAIDDGVGGNIINVPGFHVLSRDITQAPNALKLTVGLAANTIAQDQFGSPTQLQFFADGLHLFDLDRLRVSANWMAAAGNLNPDSGVLPGTYGTISFLQFLQNIDQARTMYGFVRVKLPLELGTCTTDGNCDRNALGDVVNSSDIYGFCESTSGLCGTCATTDGFKIEENRTLCGIDMSPDSQIRVKGSLLWDFVASEDNPAAGLSAGDPIPLSLLPWAPRELYFKVEVPIMVNWEFDVDLDGAMDNMFKIADVTRGGSTGTLTAPPITFADVAPSNFADYLYYTGVALTSTVFDGLDNASKYHLMMPSGYVTGWVEAFDKLNITGSVWQSIPAEPVYGLPDGYDNTILDAAAVRSNSFEDIPTYLYSGGLVDMHDHVNISGLVYIPQGMELEAKDSDLPTQQYVIGAIVVRDTFYIEAKNNTITVISSDPSTYSTALVNSAIIAAQGGGGVVPSSSFSFSGSGAGGTPAGQDDGTGTGYIPGQDLCYTGCTEGTGATSGGTPPPGANRWVEVRPQVPAP